jgi:hypothetical protein
MICPKPQYDDPILLDTASYRWLPLDGAPNMEQKAYGALADCALRAAAYRLAPGATAPASSP